MAIFASNEAPLVLLGGTFDPIHLGHLRAALEIRERLAVSEVCLLPCHIPPHRAQPSSDTRHRLAMIRLAIHCDQGETGLVLDSRECEQQQPSYTVNTLRALRSEIGVNRPIILTLGMDAFNSLPSWHQWQDLLKLAHLLVVQRPETALNDDDQLQDLLARHQTRSIQDLLSASHGGVWIESITPLGISATQIREQIRAGYSARYLVPDAVWHYIKEHRLYGYTSQS